jgi:hypothetical protein
VDQFFSNPTEVEALFPQRSAPASLATRHKKIKLSCGKRGERREIEQIK